MTSYEPKARVTCPHCEQPINLPEYTQVFALDDRDRQTLVSLFLTWQRNRSQQRQELRGYVCPVCDQLVLVLRTVQNDITGGKVLDERIVHPAARVRAPDPVVPADIAKDWQEAWAILDLSPRASAALSRRCIEATLVDAGKQNPKTRLVDMITSVGPTLPSDLEQHLDEVRKMGNIAVHLKSDSTTGSIMEINQDEAEALLTIVDELLDFYYVQPAKRAQRQAALKAKTSKAT